MTDFAAPSVTNAFALLDADTNVKADIFTYDDGDIMISISHPDRDSSVVLSLADFKRMAAAVIQRAE